MRGLMDFGFTLKPDVDLARVGSLAALAEKNGFTYGWIFDTSPLAPAVKAAFTSAASLCMLKTRMREPECLIRMFLIASRPLAPGIDMSMTTMSGVCVLNARYALTALSASATTRKSLWCSSTRR